MKSVSNARKILISAWNILRGEITLRVVFMNSVWNILRGEITLRVVFMNSVWNILRGEITSLQIISAIKKKC